MFDAHFHIIDPTFPLIKNQGYLPEPFTVPMYLKAIKNYHFSYGAVISGSFHGFDQSYLFHALEKLGKNYVGVINLPCTASDDHIVALYQKRIRGIRFNCYRTDVKIKEIVYFANRIYQCSGMHVELYMDGAQIKENVTLLAQLPKFSIDHLGLTKIGSQALLELVHHGAYVKATGFMRVDFEVLPILRTIHHINPHALLFGTDLPGTRAKRRFNPSDLELIQMHFSGSEQTDILMNNAMRFYDV